MVVSATLRLHGALGSTAYTTDFVHALNPGIVAEFADGHLFVLAYWAAVVLMFVAIVLCWVWCLGTREESEAPAGDESILTELAEESENVDALPLLRDLPQNIWSMNILASMGQAGMRHQWGKAVVSYDMRPSIVAVLSIFMAASQILALFCVIHDLDPNARPVTSKPAAAWVRDVWTVNFMKWFMVAILSINAVGEAGQCRTVVTATIETNAARLRVPRLFTLFVVMFQYIVMLCTVFVGISAILSLNDVPNIIYSGMAITFITQTDELLFEMLHQVMDLEINFMIVHGLVDDPDMISGEGTTMSGGSGNALVSGVGGADKADPGRRGSVSNDQRGTFAARGSLVTDPRSKECMRPEDLRPNQIPMWVDILNHFLVTLPMLWGLMIITRAFLTNVMPNARIVKQYHDLMGS